MCPANPPACLWLVHSVVYEARLVFALLIDGDLLVFIRTSVCCKCLLRKIAETLLLFYLITHHMRRAREVDVDFHIFSPSALDSANSYIYSAGFTTKKMTGDSHWLQRWMGLLQCWKLW